MKMQEIIQTLVWQLEWQYKMMRPVLNDISKEIAQWKPSPQARTLKVIKEWSQKGNEWLSKQNFDPVSTIEYKIIHLAQCKQMYENYAFGSKSLKWSDLECPEWPSAFEYFSQTHVKLLENIQSINDDKLEELSLTHFDEKWSFKHIITVLIYHDAYHFGQICTMKNYHQYIKSH